MESRPRWLVIAYLAFQVALPTMAVWVRLTGGSAAVPFGWQMFSTAG